MNYEARREARIAETLARRSSAEFEKAGAALLAAKKAEAERLAEAARWATEAEYETAAYNVSFVSLDRHARRFERMLKEAADDSGHEPDSIAMDILDGYLLGEVLAGRPTTAKVALALELLRVEFAMTVSEGLAHVRRIAR